MGRAGGPESGEGYQESDPPCSWLFSGEAVTYCSGSSAMGTWYLLLLSVNEGMEKEPASCSWDSVGDGGGSVFSEKPDVKYASSEPMESNSSFCGADGRVLVTGEEECTLELVVVVVKLLASSLEELSSGQSSEIRCTGIIINCKTITLCVSTTGL